MDSVENVNKYYNKIKRQFDWDEIVSQLKTDESVRFVNDNGDKEAQMFLGTVFALLPSGRYYTAWASSNVSEAEMRADGEWFEALGRVAEEKGLYVTLGENDPCDIMVYLILDDDNDLTTFPVSRHED